MVASFSFSDMPAKKNRVCPTCNKKMGFYEDKQTCDHCGTSFHKTCLDEKAITITGKSAVLLYPNYHDRIVHRARRAKTDKLPAGDTRLYREGQNKIAAMPEEEVLAEYKQRLCPQCADEVRKTAPQVGRNLEAARRYAEAASVFDDLGMYEDAGRMRDLMSKPHSPVERERVEKEKIVERQIVKIKCRFCGSLNDDVRRTCESCGANL